MLLVYSKHPVTLYMNIYRGNNPQPLKVSLISTNEPWGGITMSPVLVTYTMYAYILQSQVIINNFSVTEHIIARSKDRQDFSLLPVTCSVSLRGRNLPKLITCFIWMSAGYSMSVKQFALTDLAEPLVCILQRAWQGRHLRRFVICGKTCSISVCHYFYSV